MYTEIKTIVVVVGLGKCIWIKCHEVYNLLENFYYVCHKVVELRLLLF